MIDWIIDSILFAGYMITAMVWVVFAILVVPGALVVLVMLFLAPLHWGFYFMLIPVAVLAFMWLSFVERIGWFGLD